MKVRIREWEDMMEDFGLDEDGDIDCYCSFTPEMKEFCGKIIEVYDTEVIICDDVETFWYDDWFFSNDMYEVIED